MKKILNLLGGLALISTTVLTAPAFIRSSQTRQLSKEPRSQPNVSPRITRIAWGDLNYQMELKITLSWGEPLGYGFGNFDYYYGDKGSQWGAYFFSYLNDDAFKVNPELPDGLKTHWPVAYDTRLTTHMYKFGSWWDTPNIVAVELVSNQEWKMFATTFNDAKAKTTDLAGVIFDFQFKCHSDGIMHASYSIVGLTFHFIKN